MPPQGINKATNAFLRQAVNRTATLIGISDFPRVGSLGKRAGVLPALLKLHHIT